MNMPDFNVRMYTLSGTTFGQVSDPSNGKFETGVCGGVWVGMWGCVGVCVWGGVGVCVCHVMQKGRKFPYKYTQHWPDGTGPVPGYFCARVSWTENSKVLYLM